MMNEQAKLTQKFLKAISRRLSGRVDCYRLEYTIGIGCDLPGSGIKYDNEADYIFFRPDIYVYKDLHHRKDTDLFKVVDLICHKHFPELILERDDYGQLKIDTSKLSRGIYKYQISFDGKRRRWVRMPSRIVK